MATAASTDASRDGAAATMFMGRSLDPAASCTEIVARLTAMIGGIDRALFAQLDRILHAEPFRRLEATWRSLRYLCECTPADPLLRVRVLAVSRADLVRDFAEAVEVEGSVLFQLLYDREYGRLGGKPYAALVLDGEIGPDQQDRSLLRGLAAVAAAIHAMLLCGAAADLAGFARWADVPPHADICAAASRRELAPWQALRRAVDMRYVVLAAPRILLRAPYHPDPRRYLAYRESRGAPCFGSAAYALAARLGAAFHTDRWCSAIRGVAGGGVVRGLPTPGFSTDQADVVVRPPIELTLTERQERELAQAGVVPLCRLRGTPELAFLATPCLHDPPPPASDQGRGAPRFGVDLVPMLAASRFAHYLKCMLRDLVGAHIEAREIERKVSAWLARYTIEDANPTPERQRRHPLRSSTVQVHAQPGRPGAFVLVAHLQPHTRDCEARVALRVVTELSPDVI